MESLSSSFSRRSRQRNFSDEKFLSRVISPAIRGQSCPICLKVLDDPRGAALITVCLHAYCLECIRRWSGVKRRCPLCNAAFESWFYKINLSSRKFLTEKLPALKEGKKVFAAEAEFSSRDRRWMIQRARPELNIASQRTRPLPWRRTFGPPGSLPSRVITERKLQWRASVYNRDLRAVPLSSRNCLKQNISRVVKERLLQRIEPWIRRELQAILDDPEPSVIVHVASSLFMASLEGKSDVHSAQRGLQDNYFAPLQPFLHDRTNAFWHELRCFAESSLTMETYDSVVEYIRQD